MGGEGFEPSKASLTDLQSAPFGHSGIHPYGRKSSLRYDFLFITALDYVCYEGTYSYADCINYTIIHASADDQIRTDNLLITNQLLCR